MKKKNNNLNISSSALKRSMSFQNYLIHDLSGCCVNLKRADALEFIEAKSVRVVISCDEKNEPLVLLAYREPIYVENIYSSNCVMPLFEKLIVELERNGEVDFQVIQELLLEFLCTIRNFFSIYPSFLNTGLIGRLVLLATKIYAAAKDKDQADMIDWCYEAGDLAEVCSNIGFRTEA